MHDSLLTVTWSAVRVSLAGESSLVMTGLDYCLMVAGRRERERLKLNAQVIIYWDSYVNEN